MESEGAYLEGTGALVLDRLNRIAFVALSERACRPALAAWERATGYGASVTFTALDAAGRVVYHTNIVLAIGTGWAVLCTEAVADADERARLLGALRAGRREVVCITREQMALSCGNVLEIVDRRGLPLLACSARAHDAFTASQRAALRRHVAGFVAVPIPVIERVGGGSVRCMLAELVVGAGGLK
jgi:hypothetical protein